MRMQGNLRPEGGEKSIVKRSLRRLADRTGLRELLKGFNDNHLLTYASAMSFRVVFALVPFALCVLATLGFLDLGELWTRDVAPDLKREVSPGVYQVIDEAARNVLSSHQVFWLTAGAAIALWFMSGAVRAAMEALDDIYGMRERRSIVERLRRSLWLAAAVGGCFVLAAGVVRLGPLAIHPGRDDVLLEVASVVVRWGVAVALLGLAVSLTVRYGPMAELPTRWVTLGAALSVGSWVVMSVAFGAYLTGVASYASIYGSLAALMVLFSYVYLSTAAFLFGAQVDALVRKEAQEDATSRSG
jgi:membrane protein